MAAMHGYADTLKLLLKELEKRHHVKDASGTKHPSFSSSLEVTPGSSTNNTTNQQLLSPVAAEDVKNQANSIAASKELQEEAKSVATYLQTLVNESLGAAASCRM